MAARILPKSLPENIQKKIAQKYLEMMGEGIAEMRRSLPDDVVHGMLQDLLDAAPVGRGWHAEFNIVVHHDLLEKQLKQVSDDLKPMKQAKPIKRKGGEL
jgi:hypothetical protein